METQTQLISRNADPRSVRARFSTLSRTGASWQSATEVVALHYVNVTQRQIVASTELNHSGRRLDSVEKPWVETIDRIDMSTHRNSTVKMTERSYRHGERRVIGFVSPAPADGDVVVVVGTNQQTLSLAGTAQQTTVLNADRTRVFGTQLTASQIDTAVFRAVKQSGEITLTDDGSWLRVYAPVNGTEWIAVTSERKSSAFQAVRAVRQNVVSIVITTVLVLVGVGFVFGRHTVVPLVQLRQGTQKLAQRKFDIDLSTRRIDEIGRLYQDFTAMRDALRQQIEEIEAREQDLEELTTRLQLALEETETGVWELQPETDRLIWDEASRRLFGYEPGTFPGTYSAFLDRIHPDDITDVETQIDTALEHDEEYKTEFRIQRPDGSRRWILARGVVEHDQQGNPQRMLGVQTDITDRKQREKELQEYKEQLEQSNEKLEQFAYVASHDLQEPLRMVSSYMDLLETELQEDLDEETREYIEFAVDGAERMQAMIDGLLEYSRVQTQATPFEPVDVEDVLADTRKDLQLKLDESGVDLEIGALPTVNADEKQLGQVFQNLIKNAIEHGDQNTVIEVGAVEIEHLHGADASLIPGTQDLSDQRELPTEGTLFAVADNGPGIPDHRQDDIFDIFDKGGDSDGTGIGLAVCHQIIERHGGDIWVESTEGDGTTFFFTIPEEPE